MDRQKASDFDPKALQLYDEFVHGRISRRDFSQRIAAIATAGVTAEVIIQSLAPNYAWAQQIDPKDARIKTERYSYESPKGGGKISGLLAYPATGAEKFPSVLVVHENRGLTPYIEDVARRLAVDGFLALAPDALSPLGGYPGNDDDGRKMQSTRNGEEMMQDFMAGALALQNHELSTGKVGVVGFCYGGGVANELAVRLPETILAAVTYYGRQAAIADVPKIKGALLIHYAETDTRINEGWPAYEKALKEAGVKHEAFIYPGVNHAFHNDSTPRYDEAAAKLSWDRTIKFFRSTLL
ncbi:dienelactone hydrolase family protein [Pirellulaceae bacterium SH449]